MRLGAQCATIALAPQLRNLSALEVRMSAPDGRTLWTETVPADSLGPRLP